VTDDDSLRAVRDLAALGVSAVPSGAASLAGARAGLTGRGNADRRMQLAIGAATTVILLNTEGAGTSAPPPSDTTMEIACPTRN
jgi:diaminopropionate ammonia-lyase